MKKDIKSKKKIIFFFSSARRNTNWNCDWSSDVCSSDLELFGATLTTLDVPAVHVEWRPPAGGDPQLAALLTRLDADHDAIERANAEALERLSNGAPFLDRKGGV